MKKLNIWMLQIGEPLPVSTGVREMRTSLLARRLSARGHSVVWWASAFDHFTKKWLFKEDSRYEVAPELQIRAIKGIGYSKNLSLRRFADHRIIARKFRKFAKREKRPDIIVASMPSHDLAYQASIYAKEFGIPFVMDIRDQWPDIFFEHIPKPLHSLARLALAADSRMVKNALENSTAITSMMQTLLEWAQGKVPNRTRVNDRVYYLGAKRSVTVNARPKNLKFLDALEGKFVVAFVGTFGKYSAPLLVPKAAELLKDTEIHFVLGGNGDFFEQVAAKSSGLSNITLTGWLSEADIPHVLASAAVGLVPCAEGHEAFPNKVFTYFSAGLPVVSSIGGEMRGILENKNLGSYYTPNDPAALADAIMRFRNNPEFRTQTAENVRRFFAEELDADVIYDRFSEHIESLAR